MAEKEYIEREAARLAYKKSLANDNHRIEGASTIHRQEHRYILHILEKLPAADVVEVRHGKWILNEAWDVRTVDTLICSNCGKSFRYDVAIDYPYCPICSTKMDGEMEIDDSIPNAATVCDMVEVVRCKDCKKIWGEVNQYCDVYCGLHKRWFDKNAFCSYGERKE